MRCKKCGTILLDTDTYCGKCGTKVVLDTCPKCAEILRPGMRFCSNCGYEVIGEAQVEPEDDDIPVVASVKTTEIPFDIIEENIIRDVERQLDDVPKKKTEATDEKPIKTDRTVERVVTEKPSNAKKKQIQILPEYEEEEEEEYEDEDIEELYEDEDEDEEEFYEEDFEDFEDEDEPSVFSRLVTAGMIVLGLILVLIIALVFFKNRKESTPVENTTEVVTEESNTVDTETENESENIAGTVTIIKNVNIRDLPTTDDSVVLGVAKEGETYQYYGFADGNDNWMHIKVDEATDGYVYKDYVQF